MNTVIIHGQSHKGSTYHIARMLAEKIGFDIIEFFLPRDFGEFCLGCTRCFMESEDKCPHYEKLAPIVDALDRADVIILASPVYVYHVTGPMKAFLDHLGFRWMVHRPAESMFSKQGVCVSTAAGGGTKSTNKDMADSLFQWGVGKIYKYGCNVRATKWDTVSEKKRGDIERKTTALAKTIRDSAGHITPGPKTKGLFSIMRAVGGLSSTDKLYWKKKGWTGKKRPWK